MLFSDKSSQMNPILSGHCHQWPRVTPIIHDPKFAGKILHCPVSNKQYGIFHLDDCGQARRNHSDLDYCGPQALPMVRVLVKFCCIFAGLLLTTIAKLGHPMALVMAKFSLQLQSICHTHLHTWCWLCRWWWLQHYKSGSWVTSGWFILTYSVFAWIELLHVSHFASHKFDS